MANASRMTSLQRREQLIQVGRALFASKGFEAVSVEEIAASAKVSKPIVYEHFGGKEGLYAVIVDREMRALTTVLTSALNDSTAHPRQIVERTALALLSYIEQNADGFQVLVRDSPSTDPAGSFSSLLGDVSLKVENLLMEAFKRQKLPVKGVPYYAQMLVGMTVFTGQYWADRPKVSKEQLPRTSSIWHGTGCPGWMPSRNCGSRAARPASPRSAGLPTTTHGAGRRKGARRPRKTRPRKTRPPHRARTRHGTGRRSRTDRTGRRKRKQATTRGLTRHSPAGRGPSVSRTSDAAYHTLRHIARCVTSVAAPHATSRRPQSGHGSWHISADIPPNHAVHRRRAKAASAIRIRQGDAPERHRSHGDQGNIRDSDHAFRDAERVQTTYRCPLGARFGEGKQMTRPGRYR